MNSAVLKELLSNPSICFRLPQINTICQSLPPLSKKGTYFQPLNKSDTLEFPLRVIPLSPFLSDFFFKKKNPSY